MSEHDLDPSIAEDEFRKIARERLARQDEDFQTRWWPRIDDPDPHGRLLGYTAVWTAMVVHENWQRKKVHNQTAQVDGV